MAPTGFIHLPGYLSPSTQRMLVDDVVGVLGLAPLYYAAMPRTGKAFSVAMSNCGPLGWVSDKDGGYRYQATHPVTGARWPSMPSLLHDLWRALADYPLPPEACLINYYGPKAKLGLHRDEDEAETKAPVLSISLGDDAAFVIGGLTRGDPKRRLKLRSGDVVLLSGNARLAYHGVDRTYPGSCDLLNQVVPNLVFAGAIGTSGLFNCGGRINLTLRRVNAA